MDDLLKVNKDIKNQGNQFKGRNAHYFINRNERRSHAQSWTKKMELDYPKAIEKCVLNTKHYDNNSLFSQLDGKFAPEIIVENSTSTDAIFEHINDGKMCVLNFSSYKNPGGMFYEGSSAQEESLCHESFLYNVLNRKKDFYERNKLNLNGGLYTNQALLSPQVHFPRQEIGKLACPDVLTCASPNKSLIRYGKFTEKDNSLSLEDRIKFVCNILKENNYDVVILGAYGCGVFAQDPREVSKLFKKYLVNFSKPVKAIFAIPGGRNHDIFLDEMTRRDI